MFKKMFVLVFVLVIASFALTACSHMTDVQADALPTPTPSTISGDTQTTPQATTVAINASTPWGRQQIWLDSLPMGYSLLSKNDGGTMRYFIVGKFTGGIFSYCEAQPVWQTLAEPTKDPKGNISYVKEGWGCPKGSAWTRDEFFKEFTFYNYVVDSSQFNAGLPFVVNAPYLSTPTSQP